jgi:GH25 family lysozyme M1 (1,4-beta-N-acetylmuramidase)
MEHLRPALRVLFKDMSVWTTQAAAIAHEQTEHQATLQQAIDSNGIVIGYAHLYYASLDAAAPNAWVRPQLSHWRLRTEPALDTADKLKAAVEQCRSALETVQARRQERELMFSYTHDDSSATWCIAHGSICIRGTGEHC